MNNFFENISYLVVEVNSSCNLKCSFCNREELVSKGLRNPKNITPHELDTLLSKFDKCKIDTVKLEGISEPMLHPDFDKCAEIVKKHFPNAFVIIATNLQYDISKTPFLKTLKHVDMVYLSIDGVGEQYERFRYPAKYSRLLQSLNFIRDNVGKSDLKKLHINFVANNENVDSLPEIYKLKEDFNLASVRINIAQNWNEDEKSLIEISENFLEKLKVYKEDVKGVPDWQYSDCFWPYEGLVVDVFGDVRQCIINTSQKPICNVYTDNVEEIFNNSSHYSETRQNLSCNKAGINCNACDYKLFSNPLLKVLGSKLYHQPRKFIKC